jgi:hypothetical protein
MSLPLRTTGKNVDFGRFLLDENRNLARSGYNDKRFVSEIE